MAIAIEKGKGYFFMFVGCVFYALSLDLFLVPNNIVTGGITGAGTLINILTGFGVGIVAICLNVPILLAGLKTQGLSFVLHCFLTTTVLGFIVDFFSYLPSLTDNLILAAIYGGIFQGIGIGLFYRYKFSSGGTELLARIIRRKVPSVSPGAMIAILDGLIVLTGSFVLKNPENMLLAFITIFLSSKVSDRIITGLYYAKMVYIITQKPEEITNSLIAQSGRGITAIKSMGVYKHSKQTLLMTVIKPKQFVQLKEIIKLVDSEAFVIVSETTEVLGQGFKNIQTDDI